MSLKSITKEEINALPLGSFKGNIQLIDDQAKAIEVAHKLSSQKVLGFDTESRPSYKKGEHYPVSLLQLSTETDAYLFRTLYYEIPKELIDILSNPNIIKAGIAIRDDINELEKLCSFTPAGFVEIAEYAKEQEIKQLGLRSLAAICLNIRISKKEKLTNWEKKDLTLSQQLYAATDAWAGRELYLYFKK